MGEAEGDSLIECDVEEEARQRWGDASSAGVGGMWPQARAAGASRSGKRPGDGLSAEAAGRNSPLCTP